MKKIYKILIGIGIIIVALIIAGALFISNMEKGLEQLDNITFAELDLSETEDGTYVGGYQAGPIDVEVQVVIKGHKIDEIILIKHDNGKGGDAEAILGKVTEAQSLQVDAVTGATYSSKVILKAIEDALI